MKKKLHRMKTTTLFVALLCCWSIGPLFSQTNIEVICQSITVDVGANGSVTVNPSAVDGGSSTTCGGNISFSLSQTVFTCSNLGTNNVTLTGTDNCGNSGSCPAVITVQDVLAPSFSCPQDITVNLDPGDCEAIVNWVVPVGTDNCGTSSTQQVTGPPPGSTFDKGTVTQIGYIISDNLGNGAVCNFSVTVNEYPFPISSLACNDDIDIVLNNNNCQEEITADMILEGGPYGCYDDYVVTIIGQGDNIVDGSDVGQTLTVRVTDPTTNNYCETDVDILDNSPPVITCPCTIPSTCILSCTELPSFLAGGGPQPTVTDACAPTNQITVTFSDNVQNFTCQQNAQYQATVVRTWTATDPSGNSSSCSETFNFERTTIADVTYPPNYDNVQQPALSCINPCTDISCTGVPTGFCNNINYTFDDQTLPSCDGAYDILRTWTVVDWCTNTIDEHTQIIKVMDNDPPTIICTQDVTISAGAGCEGAYVLPFVSASDACSNNVSISVTGPGGSSYNQGQFVTGLGLGEHIFTYSATDACGNTSTCQHSVTVIDGIPPIAICDQQTSVALGSDGTAQICWQTIDDGSYDNCQVIDYKLKRADDPSFVGFTDCVSFSCIDVGNPVTIRLRVYDNIGSGSFAENDPLASYNECTAVVTVQDLLDPTITCPPTLNLDCNQWNQNNFPGVNPNPPGAPTYFNGNLIGYYPGATDGCSDVTVTITQSGGLDNCGDGSFTRIYTAEDGDGNTVSCVQFINVQNSTPFFICDNRERCYTVTSCSGNSGGIHSLTDGVEWPCDITLDNCNGVDGLDPEDLEPAYPLDAFPQIDEDICDLVGLDWDDQVFPITDPGCIKILRTWTIVDWCQPNSSYPLGYVTWTYIQEIKVLGSSAPIINGCADVTVCGYDADCEPFNTSGDPGLILDASDDCTNPDDLNYIYSVDLFNDNNGGYDFTGMGNDANGEYPIGTHKICWTVEDGCGNTDQCCYLFTVEDCKQPTPVCLNGLATVIMPFGGQVCLDATFFENGDSYDNCTPYSELIFSFSSNVNDQTMCFDCDDLGADTVQIWVTDEYGNQDYCETYVLIQDPNQACDTTGQILFTMAGIIATDIDQGVANVDVNFSTGNGYSQMYTTDVTGSYFVPGIPAGTNASLDPSKDVGYKNGVTTWDLVLISQHMLGIQFLDSPYKIIAADVDNSGNINVFDIIKIRELILGYIDEFEEVESWRFVEKAYVFPNANNPFSPAFPEVISVNNLSEDVLDNDFVAVKMGDVNNTANPSNDLVQIDTRTFNGTQVLEILDQEVYAGNTYEVEVLGYQLQDLLGYQYTLSFDADVLKLVDLLPNADNNIGIGNFNLGQSQNGLVSTSWNISSPLSINHGKLYTLVFEALANGRLRDLISLESFPVVAEAYSSGLEVKAVGLRFADEQGTLMEQQEAVLYQNQPNPFLSETVLSFYLPEPGAATVTIFDVSGKIQRVINGDFSAGYQTVTLERNDFGSSGVYYYQLETEDFSGVKKMILLD